MTNSNEFYEFLRKKRGIKKAVVQMPTVRLQHPNLLQRAVLAGETHIWATGDRFYKLAHKYYNDSRYWWVIAWYNGYPTEGHIKKGTLIEIPLDLEKVLLALGL